MKAGRKLWAGAGLGLVALIAIFVAVDFDAHSYRTDIGEVRQVALEDGSALIIDAQSHMRVDLDADEREVTLKQGRVLFRVAHNAARPFRVMVGDVTITDIGTVFSVSETAGEITVLVSEGEVGISGPTGHLRLKAGQRASFAHGKAATAQTLSAAGIERALAWTSGRFELDGDTLASAIVEMNNHNHRQIRLVDPALGREKLYGAFRLDDPQGFAQAVSLGIGARWRADGDDLVIDPK